MANLTPESIDAAFDLITAILLDKKYEPSVRAAAATALGQAGGEKAMHSLKGFLHLQNASPPEVRAAALLAIGHLIGDALARA